MDLNAELYATPWALERYAFNGLLAVTPTTVRAVIEEREEYQPDTTALDL